MQDAEAEVVVEDEVLEEVVEEEEVAVDVVVALELDEDEDEEDVEVVVAEAAAARLRFPRFPDATSVAWTCFLCIRSSAFSPASVSSPITPHRSSQSGSESKKRRSGRTDSAVCLVPHLVVPRREMVPPLQPMHRAGYPVPRDVVGPGGSEQRGEDDEDRGEGVHGAAPAGRRWTGRAERRR